MQKIQDPDRPWLAEWLGYRDWSTFAPSLPYRASISTDAEWSFKAPRQEMIDVQKRCRGKRTMLAFELAEVRDLFVDGHFDNRAMTEADFADVPDRTLKRPRPERTGFEKLDLEEIFARTNAAIAVENAAEDAVCNVFAPVVDDLISRGDAGGALAVIHAMPKDSTEKTLSMDRVMKSGIWDRNAIPYDRVYAARLTAPQATVSLDLHRSQRIRRRMTSEMGIRAMDHLRELLVTSHEEAEAFARTVPRSVEKAFMMDAIYQARIEASKPPSP
jgi:hypothetical protein